jgi:hypothetical protein
MLSGIEAVANLKQEVLSKINRPLFFHYVLIDTIIRKRFFTVTTRIMCYKFYLITLLHVSVPKNHHQVDPQSTKVVIIFLPIWIHIGVHIHTRCNKWFFASYVFLYG